MNEKICVFPVDKPSPKSSMKKQAARNDKRDVEEVKSAEEQKKVEEVKAKGAYTVLQGAFGTAGDIRINGALNLAMLNICLVMADPRTQVCFNSIELEIEAGVQTPRVRLAVSLSFDTVVNNTANPPQEEPLHLLFTGKKIYSMGKHTCLCPSLCT